jgi:hypothetical protein
MGTKDDDDDQRSGLRSRRRRRGRRGGAIEVVDSSEVLILGCQVLDPKFRGIDIRNCRNTKVSECQVVDRQARPTMRDLIHIVGC